MTLRVFTARLSYAGVDRLDITRAGADAYRKRTGLTWEGAAFAPSWELLRPLVGMRRELRGRGHRAHESQASALAERIARADLGNKQRSRALRSITVGANYRSRLATKGAKKQQMKKAWGKK